MNKYKLQVKDLEPIDVWVTPNVVVFRQTAIWSEVGKLYQFVPSGSKGFVILTKANEKMHCRQSQGYRLHRPASLTISWLTDKVLNFREISMLDSVRWYVNHQGKWKDIGEIHYTTLAWEETPL